MTLLRKIFNPGQYSENIALVLLFLRVIVGAFMLTHGYGKFLKLIGDAPVEFADPVGIGETASLALAVFAEFFCSIFLIFGLATRFSAFSLLITMLVVAIIVHAPDPFMRKELPMLYAAIYIVILKTGAGKYSVDTWIFNRMKG